jgi:hypothetical protein
VVQKASFRSPEFIGFFAPISEIRAGLLPKHFEPVLRRAGLLLVRRFRKQLLMPATFFFALNSWWRSRSALKQNGFAWKID